MKKFLSFLLAAMLVLGMVGSAAAEDTTISMDNNGHTYQVFQLFTADISGDVLSNVKWGTSAASGYSVGAAVPQETLDALVAVNNESDIVKRNTVLPFVDLTKPVTELSSTKLSDTVPTGYYVIMDKAGTVPEGESYTFALIEIAGSITITPKASAPEFEKKIQDKNDTAGTTSNWQDSADYDIGDAVPYKLTATLPSNYTDYTKEYMLVFHDTLEAGSFSFNNDVKVYVGSVADENQVTTNLYSVDTTGANVFNVTIPKVQALTGVTNGSKIIVTYSANLLATANVGKAGNINTANLEFSNNPNWNGEGTQETGETPDDTVIAFTYQVIVNKVDKDKQPLTGAEFALYKKNSSGTWDLLSFVKNETGTTFTFTGLDDGDYKIEETETPAGKNTIASPIYFTVTADHNVEVDPLTSTNRESVLTSLAGTVDQNLTTGQYAFAASTDTGSLSTDVVNLSGATLPSTGGIGTTIFYLLGSIMFIGAAMTLVVRRRADAEEV